VSPATQVSPETPAAAPVLEHNEIVFHPLCQISSVEMRKLRDKPETEEVLRKTIGIPVYVATDSEGLSIFPAPSKDYRLRVRYIPQVKEV
jgi:hypothetical protein